MTAHINSLIVYVLWHLQGLPPRRHSRPLDLTCIPGSRGDLDAAGAGRVGSRDFSTSSSPSFTHSSSEVVMVAVVDSVEVEVACRVEESPFTSSTTFCCYPTTGSPDGEDQGAGLPHEAPRHKLHAHQGAEGGRTEDTRATHFFEPHDHLMHLRPEDTIHLNPQHQRPGEAVRVAQVMPQGSGGEALTPPFAPALAFHHHPGNTPNVEHVVCLLQVAAGATGSEAR